MKGRDHSIIAVELGAQFVANSTGMDVPKLCDEGYFLPDVAYALGTTCIISEHVDVANAVGAVAGNIKASCTIEVRPQSDGNIVYGVSNNYTTSEYFIESKIVATAIVKISI